MKLILLDKKTKAIKQILECADEEEVKFWEGQFDYYEKYCGEEDVNQLTYSHKLVEDKFMIDPQLEKENEEKERQARELEKNFFFEQEHGYVSRIFMDSQMDLVEVTVEETQELKEYIKSINPKTETLTFKLIQRPEILNRLYPI